MAVNVYLVFFCSANPTAFRRYLWLYCLICFGAPAIPAIVCLIHQAEDKTRIYGDATVSSPGHQLQCHPSSIGLTQLDSARLSVAVVLDRPRLELSPHLHVLPTHLGLHRPVHCRLLRRRLPCVSTTEPAAKPDAERSGKGGVVVEFRCARADRKGQERRE